jgi:small-conductance mechanosensitive channel
MESNTHLEQVDLRNNGIGDDGAMAFGQSLLCNDSLRVLDLRWNQIGDDGARSFEKVLLQRKTQLTILLAGNLVSHKVTDLVEKWSQAYRKQEEEPVEEEKPPTPPLEVDTYELRYKELLKEHNSLKHKHSTIMTQHTDMRRQLDVSAITVTDLEQKLLREEFHSSQWEEQLRVARQKISEMTNEYLVASQSWNSQRMELAEDHKRALSDMTTEIKGHVADKESLKERLRKAKVRHSPPLPFSMRLEIDE